MGCNLFYHVTQIHALEMKNRPIEITTVYIFVLFKQRIATRSFSRSLIRLYYRVTVLKLPVDCIHLLHTDFLSCNHKVSAIQFLSICHGQFFLKISFNFKILKNALSNHIFFHRIFFWNYYPYIHIKQNMFEMVYLLSTCWGSKIIITVEK